MPRVKPLPPAIVSTEPGTSRRLNEEILERTWQDCLEDWAKDDEAAEKYEEVKQRFQAFRDELSAAANTRLSYLDPLPPAASKVRRQEWQDWHDILEPYITAKNTWLTAPWMVTEFYAYRRLMECLGYFDEQSPCYMYDPFAKQKRAGLVSSTASAEPMLAKINVLAETTVDDEASGIRLASDVALWGNKMDLSLWPADGSEDAADVFTEILHKAAENLLSDDSEKLIIVDNAGFELVTDLALAQYLIESGIASTVTFQLKSHPTFVSDALEKDLLDTVDYYLNQVDATRFPACRSATTRWQSYLEHGQWQTIENSFWVQGLPMWDMPDALRTDLVERCHLAVVRQLPFAYWAIDPLILRHPLKTYLGAISHVQYWHFERSRPSWDAACLPKNCTCRRRRPQLVGQWSFWCAAIWEALVTAQQAEKSEYAIPSCQIVCC